MNARGTRATPLHYAAFCGLHDITTFLIVEHSQNVNSRGFDNRETPLHVALRRGHADIAQLLLEHGAGARAQDDDIRTPLHWASGGGHLGVARVLVERGAGTNARDNEDWSPLEQAVRHGHLEVAQILLGHGADVKTRDKNNQTLLYHAEREEIVRFLLKHGTDAETLDIFGRSALYHASEHGYVGVVRALREHGVGANARDANNATVAIWYPVLDVMTGSCTDQSDPNPVLTIPVFSPGALLIGWDECL